MFFNAGGYVPGQEKLTIRLLLLRLRLKLRHRSKSAPFKRNNSWVQAEEEKILQERCRRYYRGNRLILKCRRSNSIVIYELQWATILVLSLLKL